MTAGSECSAADYLVATALEFAAAVVVAAGAGIGNTFVVAVPGRDLDLVAAERFRAAGLARLED